MRGAAKEHCLRELRNTGAVYSDELTPEQREAMDALEEQGRVHRSTGSWTGLTYWWLALLALCACQPYDLDAEFGIGPRDGCDQVYPLIDVYVLRTDRAPADWRPTTTNPDCGRLPPDFPEGCDEIGPRESWDGPGARCFVHIDYDCEGRDTEAWWYTIQAGTDGLVVGAADCGWQVFFD